MTDELTLTIKEILDKAGLEFSVEQIEAGLAATDKELSEEGSRPNEIAKKFEENKVDDNQWKDCQSFKGKGKYYIMSGHVDLEYSGRAHKKYQGDAILLIKPDDCLVVHGMRGVNPVSYIARAEKICLKDQDGHLTVAAWAGTDRLIMTFLKMNQFDNLFENIQTESIKKPAARPTAEKMALTDEEKALEARLRKLRLELARRDDISFLPAIYDNRTMYQLVRQRPRTLEELKQVKGFGTKRVERYAASVLETINSDRGDQANA
jgi:hypothetical protein